MSVIRGGNVIEGAGRRRSVIRETVLSSAFTDGTGASGTYVMAESLPAGSLFSYAKITCGVAFSGDTSAVITLGDGSDVDRYNTGTPSVFTTGEKLAGEPSGVRYTAAAQAVTITITGGSDWGAVNVLGSVTIELFYHES